MLNDGLCSHGIPLGESCLLCANQAERDVSGPTPFDEDLQTFVNILERREEWLKSGLVIDYMKARFVDPADSKRFTRDYVRHLAQASSGLIMGGQSGYKATRKATGEESTIAAAALMKTARGVMKRRSDILFVKHNGRTKTEIERNKYEERIKLQSEAREMYERGTSTG